MPNYLSGSLKRDAVCNAVTHVLKAIKVFKRFSQGCKPRPAWVGGGTE